LARVVLNDQTVQEKLLSELLLVMEQKGYQGLDVDFEYVSGDDAAAYAQWIDRLRQALSPLGLPVSVALAPKTSADQPGLLYEGHNYRLLGQAADYVLLMTYEWGYTYGPPMAVAPIQNVRRVVEYALREIPAEKIFLGIPDYGYDWTRPFQKGSKATSISNLYAVTLAWQNGAAIRYDEAAQSPWFRYVDAQGREHEVWFEDARSIAAKLSLAQEKGLYGVSVWNLDRPFPQNWLVLNSLYNIREASGFFQRDIVQ
jgi:spore germination protein